MAEPDQTFETKTGTLKIFEDRIRIERNGVRANLIHGPTEKEIYVENITSINTTMPPNGMLEFEENGEISNESGGIFFGHSSESSLQFSSADKQRRAKEAVQAKMREQKDGATKRSPKERLDDLEAMLEDGQITEDEYERKRQDILDDV